MRCASSSSGRGPDGGSLWRTTLCRFASTTSDAEQQGQVTSNSDFSFATLLSSDLFGERRAALLVPVERDRLSGCVSTHLDADDRTPAGVEPLPEAGHELVERGLEPPARRNPRRDALVVRVHGHRHVTPLDLRLVLDDQPGTVEAYRRCLLMPASDKLVGTVSTASPQHLQHSWLPSHRGTSSGTLGPCSFGTNTVHDSPMTLDAGGGGVRSISAAAQSRNPRRRRRAGSLTVATARIR